MLALRPPHQPTLPHESFSDKVESRQHANVTVGYFFDRLTAALVSGELVAANGPRGENPDVVGADGAKYESKASCGYRWIMQQDQFEAFEKTPRAHYVLWDYEPCRRPGGLASLGRTDAIRRFLASHVRRCYLVPAHLVREILARTPYEKPRYSNKVWWWNYWLPKSLVRAVIRGDKAPAGKVVVERRRFDSFQVLGHYADFVAYRFVPIDGARDGTWARWVGRGRLVVRATAEERDLAAVGLKELESQRNRIVLLPAPRPSFPSHKIRSIAERNPAWLVRMNARRRKRTGRWWKSEYGIKRSRVKKALERVLSGTVDPRGYEGEILGLLGDGRA